MATGEIKSLMLNEDPEKGMESLEFTILERAEVNGNRATLSMGLISKKNPVTARPVGVFKGSATPFLV